MAYLGSTQASSLANPPVLIGGRLGGSYPVARGTTGASTTVTMGRSVWLYSSTDSSTLAQTAGYFSDAATLGLQQNDVMFVVWQSSIGSSQVLAVGLVSSLSTAGAASINGYISST